jgi:chitinase
MKYKLLTLLAATLCSPALLAAQPLDLAPEVVKPRFWMQATVVAQMDRDPALERVMLFSRDNGHYPYFDLFVNYYAIVDEDSGEVQYISGEVISTGRDLMVEDRNGDGMAELHIRYIAGGNFTTDYRGNDLTAQWIHDTIEPTFPPKVVLGYVTSWTQSMPDARLLTHLNYAFGHVTDTFDGVRVSNPDRLYHMWSLKSQNPALKILLSIGGWGSGRFSEMAASDEYRQKFAADCKRVVDEFGLDGIDIDWEYPTSAAAGISASPDDRANFTLMMRDIREAIGPDKLLTLATVANAGNDFIDFRAIDPCVDLVNMMTYDMDSSGHRHHSGLYRSELSPGVTTHEATESHLAAGVPRSKLVMGVPFYGRAIRDLRGYTNYKQIVEITDYNRAWDAVAQAPYLADPATGEMVAGYDDPRSLLIKTEYIRTRGLRGIMYWDFEGDDAGLTLSKTIFYALYPELYPEEQ